MTFTITHSDHSTSARCGLLELNHGTVSTPVFMPVGTNGTVKALPHAMIDDLGYNLILGNTYHLYLRPGPEVIEKAGGLHEFSSWKGSVLTCAPRLESP